MAYLRGYQAVGGKLGKIDCPRSIPKSEGGFKEFRLGDLFVASNGDTDIQAIHINGKGTPVVSSGTKNNGIIGLSDIEAKIFEPRTITVDMFGNCYFQKTAYKMVTHARVFSLSPSGFQLNEKRGLYFVAHFSFANNLFSYGNMASWQKMKEYKLSLPILKNGTINWVYIESLVEEIINSRKNELNKFFASYGYSDCSLTDIERQALTDFSMGNVHMQEKTIKDLFSVVKGKRLTKANMTPGNTNFIGASETENGITNRISNSKYIHPGNLITVTYNGSVGESFYQPYPFWASDDVNILYPTEKLSESQSLFFLAPLRKKGKRYAYAFKWAKEIMEQDSIYLPVTDDGSIDYDFMENYINALKKQCIARLKASNIF